MLIELSTLRLILQAVQERERESETKDREGNQKSASAQEK